MFLSLGAAPIVVKHAPNMRGGIRKPFVLSNSVFDPAGARVDVRPLQRLDAPI
jgi:hypothetical protein